MRDRNHSAARRGAARRSFCMSAALAAAFLCAMPVALGACTGPADSLPGTAAIARALPPLPNDGPAALRRVSTASTLPGYPAYQDCGAGVAQHATIPEVLVLDSTGLDSAAHEFTWAIWRMQLSAGVTVGEIKVTTYQSVGKTFYAGLANYAAGVWQLERITVNGASLHLPAQELDLHSPGECVYLAVVVMAGQKVSLQALDITTSGGAGNDPIFDDFEPNDPMASAWHLGPGYYRASIHETFIPEMGGRDKMDFYTVTLGAGQSLTTTLDYEPYDHLWAPGGDLLTPSLNDLDVLIYPPGSSLPYDQFLMPPASGMSIYYYAADEGFYTSASGGEYIIGILGDVSDPYNIVDNNAEYHLGIYVSNGGQTHSVSGTVAHNGAEITTPFLVYLEYTVIADDDRGFFNAVAGIDTAPHGKFTVLGVPDGAYTLYVRSSAAFYAYPAHPATWPQTLGVTVAGADVTDANIDITGEPPF
jgi:hypothetical protein